MNLFGKPPVRSSSEDKEDLHDQKKQVFKLYMRIWITAARQIKSQCEKQEGRPVELKHIGIFIKSKGDNYTYVPNEELLADGRLKLATVNNENQL